MMSRIDRIRRSALTERTSAANDHAAADETRPVSTRRVQPAAPPHADEGDAAAIFTAQLMGQDGQKRGLRAGPLAIDAARGAYNKVEWSGSRDRRARAGRTAKTSS